MCNCRFEGNTNDVSPLSLESFEKISLTNNTATHLALFWAVFRQGRALWRTGSQPQSGGDVSEPEEVSFPMMR